MSVSSSPVDKAQKTSAAIGLGTVAILLLLVTVGSIKGWIDQRSKARELAGVLSEIERIDASNESASSKSKKVLEIAYSSWDIAAAVDGKHEQNHLLNRVAWHVQAGYQQADPLTPSVFDKAAEATCIIRVGQVSPNSPTFMSDSYTAYIAAKRDLEAWRPYLADYDEVWGVCAHRFRVMQDRHVKRMERTKSVSMRDIGMKVGEATTEVERWWDSATKPLSDALNEFKSGYNAGK